MGLVAWPPADPNLRSSDVPSGPGVRPWGLTRTTPVGAAHHFDGLHYDPERQITTTADGVPLIDADRPKDPTGPYTPCDTKFDHQWETDSDPAD